MCCPGSLQVALRSLAASRPELAAYCALVALTGAADGPGEVITLRGLKRALPSLSERALGRAAGELVALGHWAAHPDGYVSAEPDVGTTPDTPLERKRARWRRAQQAARDRRVATPIATPDRPPQSEEPKQGPMTSEKVPSETCFGQQALPLFANDSVKGGDDVITSRHRRHRDRKPKPPKVKKPRQKSPKDLRLEHIRARYVAAYLERFGVEPGLPAWSLVQRVETWLRRNAPKIGKTFDELVDLVITGYFMDDWALDTECPFKPLSDNPARFYRAAAGLTEPRRIPKRFVAPAPPSPPGSCDDEDLTQIRRENAETRARIERERAACKERARLARLEQRQAAAQ